MGKSCLSENQIITNGGQIIKNSDGTVSVYELTSDNQLYPVQLTSVCCSVLSNEFFFDIDTQTCRWSLPKLCGFSEPINLIINPKGDDGSLFFIDDTENETCNLKISFDYLFKIKCEDLFNLTNPNITTQFLSSETISQINGVESDIIKINSEIEALTNELVLLNEQYLQSYYSINCSNYPVPVDTGATTCFEYSVSLIDDGTVSWTDCNGNIEKVILSAGSNFIIPCAQIDSLSGFSYTITATNPCNVNLVAKFESFEKSAFNKKEIDLPAIDSVFNETLGETTTVNFCLTEPYGLEVWATILGPIRYQQFLDGNPDSYTCDDVITIAGQTWPQGEVVFECDTTFGIKTTLLIQINELAIKISQLNETLTQLQTLLIDLNNDFIVTQTDSFACNNPIEALEAFDVSMFLDVVNEDNTIESVFEYSLFPAIGSGNLYNYLSGNTNSGFFICGDPNIDDVGLLPCSVLSLNTTLDNPNVYSCESIINDILTRLFSQSGLDDMNSFLSTIPDGALGSSWRSYSTLITDPDIISLITNKKIKIKLRVNYSCVDFCILLDNIVLDKSCNKLERTDIVITKNPGFNLSRVIDNKKSWIDTTELTNREFKISKNDGTNSIRETDYDVNDERLVINTKEIDLDISVASAIETDVWCYLNDNTCLLTGCTESILTVNDPFSDNLLEFSLPPSNSNISCVDYNNKVKTFFETENPLNYSLTCGNIYEFYFVAASGESSASFLYFTQEWDGTLGFYYRNSESFLNLSLNFDNLECCEDLATNFSNFTDKLNETDRIVPYWDEDCQKCKVRVNTCGDNKVDFNNLLTQPISGITTIEQFDNLLTSELIDVKNRQTISSYPTLRALYDRYLNSSGYCGTLSSGFNYENMDKFAGLVGNYWIDLIEQVVPSTSIWGSVKVHTNTLFDEQKYKYKGYSSLFCENPFSGYSVPSPINGTSGESITVDSTLTSLTSLITQNPKMDSIRTRNCSILNIVQMNSGSEFIGTVNVTPKPSTGCNSSSTNINECTLSVIITESDGELIATPFGGGSIEYLWNNGETTQTITTSGSGIYSVTITDTEKCCSATANYEIKRLKACWYTMAEKPEFMMGTFYQNLYGLCSVNNYPNETEVVFTIESLLVNGVEQITNQLTNTVNLNNLNWVSAENNIVYQCILGNPTGMTYTNFVDFLNLSFESLGLNGYKAQVSLKEQKIGDSSYYEHNGFYIIYPEGDTFEMKTTSSTNTDYYKYSDVGLSEWNPIFGGGTPWGRYLKSFCDGITLINGVVLE